MLLRPYSPGDAEPLGRLWYASWRSVGLETPVVAEADVLARVPREAAGRWTTTVAEADGEIVGFVALALAETRLDQLFIAPGAQGRGVGRVLFEVAVQAMPNGFWLSTQVGNVRARRFYEGLGMRLDRIEPDAGGDRAIYVFAGGSSPPLIAAS